MAASLADTQLLSLEEPSAWPDELVQFLDSHRDLFIDWSGTPKDFSAQEYDAAIGGLARLLGGYALVGWHCTRLTDAEIKLITTDGMEPLNTDMLHRRIDRLVTSKALNPVQAERLKAKHQASDASRVEMLWFCFFPPHRAGRGIFDLLRFWGGEALYNSHDSDPELGPILHALGTPAVVEAAIPIAMLGDGARPAFSVVAHYLRAQGRKARDYIDFEDRIAEALPPKCVRRIVCYPSQAFCDLTGCNEWQSGWADTWGERGRGAY